MVDANLPNGSKNADWRLRELREFEKGQKEIDLQAQFKEMNKGLLSQYGRDKYTYRAELHDAAHNYWKENEARFAHGYPATAWIQMGFIYAAGVYTAREQGCVPRNTMFTKFWQFHYFDWLTFLRRSGVYGIGGGLVAGTVLFGSPDVSIKRVINRYQYFFHEDALDVRGDGSNLQISQI